MKFTINRELLLSTLQNVSRGLSDKKPFPVLTGIQIKVLKDKIGDDDVKDSLIKDLCEQHILKYRARQDKDYDRYEKMSKLYQQTLSTVDLKPKNTEKNVISNNPDECWGVFQQIVENYSPAEFIKEKDKKVFKDYNEQDEYYRRFIIRPTENLVNGTTTMDEEYSIKVEDDD